MNFNPQPGRLAATATAIAYAPTLNGFREPLSQGGIIEFNGHGHSSRTVSADNTGVLTLTITKPPMIIENGQTSEAPAMFTAADRRPTSLEQTQTDETHNWVQTAHHGLGATLKFVSTPTGFLMTIYGLNIVAWGAMLFFLLLGAAPAMNHPSKGAINSPRKIWIEIDSQILTALFSVTGFGLAPWRFRDLCWLIQASLQHNKKAMQQLYKQNKSWFRPPAWYYNADGESREEETRVMFTGEVAPPTKIWKLAFVVWMMVLNTLLQGVLSGMMWGYNRITRPSWATGTFIALGCVVILFAGLMKWWEGRKVKKIEGKGMKLFSNNPAPVRDCLYN